MEQDQTPDQEQTQDQDGYLSAFTEPTATPASEAQDTEPKQVSQPEPPVEYVQITKDVYDRISKAVERLPNLEQEFARRIDTAFGKIGGLERDFKQSPGAFSDADLAPFKEDFPELHQALSKVRAPAGMDFDGVMTERTKPLVERLDSTLQELRETQEMAVAAVHPDYQEFTQSEAFQTWLATKDDEYRQRLATAWSPKVIVSALNEAKKFRAPSKKSARTDTLEAAIQPRGTGGRFESTGNTEQDGYASAWS